MATIATLDTVLRANTDRYNSKIKKASQTTSEFGRMASKAMKSAAAAVIAYAGASGWIKLARWMDKIRGLTDDIDKISRRMQISTDAVQTLGFAFEQNGGSVGDMERAMRAMNTQFLNLSRDLTTAQDLFSMLGLTMEDLIGLTPEEKFLKIAQGLRNIEDANQRAAVATQVFGRSGATLLPLINNVGALRQELIDSNLVIDESTIRIGADLTDALNKNSRAFQKLGGEMLKAFGPLLIRTVKSATDVISRGLEAAIKNWNTLQKAIIKFRFGYDIQEATPIAREAAEEFDREQEEIDKEARKRQAMADWEKRKAQKKAHDERMKQLDSEISKQQKAVSRLRSRRPASLPQALQQGSAATISFLNNLNRKDKAEEQRQRQIDIQQAQLDQLIAQREEERRRFEESQQTPPVEVEIL